MSKKKPVALAKCPVCRKVLMSNETFTDSIHCITDWDDNQQLIKDLVGIIRDEYCHHHCDTQEHECGDCRINKVLGRAK
jgi:hypothetical protein